MQCLECQTPIKGRSDKKFCSDACRVHYHNKISADYSTLKRSIHLILNRNRKILKKINDQGIKTMSKTELVTLEYNFDYHTSVFYSSNQKTYYYCYDYGYCHLGDEKLLVVKSNKKGV
ncbi:MAG: hypothetical protein K9H58_18025 [Bacteroidales bacterium]|nr:hypothetical protein [Bacteroidales bacterium]